MYAECRGLTNKIHFGVILITYNRELELAILSVHHLLTCTNWWAHDDLAILVKHARRMGKPNSRQRNPIHIVGSTLGNDGARAVPVGYL